MSITNLRQTFVNPAVPFAGTILGGLLPGEMVLVQGSVLADSDRFQLDLTCGSSVKPRADVAFHFNPRFNKKCIVCNTLQKERWGREEILHRMPFTNGEAFELLVLVLKDKFQVAVNGAHVLDYKHRLDLGLIDTLALSGKVKVDAVGILPSIASSGAPSASQKKPPAESQLMILSSIDLSTPFRGELVGGLQPGRTIAIKGHVRDDANRFSVDLGALGSGDIALHLNARMRDSMFTRNSFLSGCWGSEEHQLKSFPFRAGKYFEMIILCEAQAFKIAVNGTHQCAYRHRVQDLRGVTGLQVGGDVTLEEVVLL